MYLPRWYKKRRVKLQIFVLLAVFLGNWIILSNALAWKPTTHVYLAEQAMEDALADGKVTIYRVNYQQGEIVGEIGQYKVDGTILSALHSNAAQYRAGVLGPDAYPDILTGQQVIHPGPDDTGIQGGSNVWLKHLWERSMEEQGPNISAIKAFTVGYLTHAAGDMYGHTFINLFSGGSFAINPPTGPINAIKHILVEGYVDKRLPKYDLDTDFFNASIIGVEDFIYYNLIDARPGSVLDRQLLREGGGGTEYSIPRIYSTLRAILQRDISAYYAKKREYTQRANDCEISDFSCSKVAILAERAAYIAENGLNVTYKEYWRDDIDSGLRKWPKVSHEVAKALFFNPDRKPNIQRAEDILKRYVTDHILSMSGTPDLVGLTAREVSNIIERIIPDFLLEPIQKLKEELLNTILKEAVGLTKQEIKDYLTSPEKYFDRFLNSGSGKNVTLREFNTDCLHINNSGYTNPNESFDYRKVPAAYNTVTISKLIMLSSIEMDKLLSDLGSHIRQREPNIMLGFIQALDGDNQWINKLILARDSQAYKQVFMLQLGELRNDENALSSPTRPTIVKPR